MLDVRPKSRQRRSDAPSRTGSRKWLLPAVFLLVALLLVSGSFAVYHAKPVDQANQNQEIIQVGQQMVRESLQDDLKSAFCPEEETNVAALSDGKFLVSGWVDLMSVDGQSDRQNFSVVLFKNEADDWVGEKLAVMPQVM